MEGVVTVLWTYPRLLSAPLQKVCFNMNTAFDLHLNFAITFIFTASNVRQEPEQGRPLRTYDETPQNHKLQTNIERVSKLGLPLAMKCTSDLPIESCHWTTPSGETMDMKRLPKGYTSVIDNEKTCHMMIESLSKEQLGKWSCIVKQKGSEQYQQAFMTATEVVPVTDVRLPVHVVPEVYIIHLTPFIFEGNYTIEGNCEFIF